MKINLPQEQGLWNTKAIFRSECKLGVNVKAPAKIAPNLLKFINIFKAL